MPWERPPRIGELLFSPSMGICEVLSVYPAFDDDGLSTGIIYELEAPAGRIKLLLENVRKQTRPLMSRGTALQVLGIIGDRLDAPQKETPGHRAYSARVAEQTGDPIGMARALQKLLMRADGYGSASQRISVAEQKQRARLVDKLCDELKRVLKYDSRAFMLRNKSMKCEDFLRSFSRRLAAKATVRPNPAAVAENQAMYVGREMSSLNRSWKALLRRLSPTAKVPVNEMTRKQIAEKQIAILRTLDESL